MADYLSTLNSNYSPRPTKMVPFKIYLQITPAQTGRRWTSIRDKQKFVADITAELDAAGWQINLPISSAPGIKGAVTIVGNHPLTWVDNPNTSPVTELKLIHNSNLQGENTRVISGNAGVNRILSQGRETTLEQDAAVAAFKAQLESDSPTVAGFTSIENIEFGGVMYGKEARSYPS